MHAPDLDKRRLRVAGRGEETSFCELAVQAGEAALRNGDREAALSHFLRACRVIYRYPPAKTHIDAMAADLRNDARRSSNPVSLLVRAIELNPDSKEARAELADLLPEPPVDLTRQTLAQWDKKNAEKRYRNAIKRCVDFTASRGIDGDVLEFGVLGGWTARIFAETIRDVFYPCDLWLFDSFEGLPVVESAVDVASYEIERGIWKENMNLPAGMYAQSGMRLDEHIRDRLSTVISAPRIHVRKGYFSDGLADPIEAKAAIVHLDCDLYSSTKEVLDGLERHSVLQDGTLLMFDDWNCNRANPRYGQRRALREFLSTNPHYETSPFINHGPNAAIFILHDTR